MRDAAYESLLKSQRRQLHAAHRPVLEERSPEAAETQPELLAQHCAEAGLAEKAVGYRHEAGQRAIARSAMAEAVAQLTRKPGALAGLPAGRDRDRTELDLRVALGGAFISTRGWAAPEVGETYGRARELCGEEAQHPQLLAALSGLQAHHLHRSGAGVGVKIAEELLRAAERSGTPTCGPQATDPRPQPAVQRSAVLGPDALRAGSRPPRSGRPGLLRDLAGADIRVACLCFTALILLWQGYPDRALACGEEALAAAHELATPSRRARLCTDLLAPPGPRWVAGRPGDEPTR